MTAGIVVLVIILLAVFILAKTAVVVPQQAAYVVERLGRYSLPTLTQGDRHRHPRTGLYHAR